MSVYHVYVWDLQSQKRLLDPLVMELLMVVSTICVLGINLWSSARTASVLHC